MEQQTKGYEDETNLYDLWKIIAKKKRIIIGLFLVVVISTAIISFIMPKIYRGEAIINTLQNEAVSERITARDIIEIIGNIDYEKRIKILPKTHASVTNIKLKPVKDSKDKIIVIIDAKNVDDIPQTLSELLDYINNFAIVKMTMKDERENLLSRLAELSEIIRSSSDMLVTYHKLLKAGKLMPVGFNPIDLNKKIADIKLEKLTVEQTLRRIQNGYIEVATLPYVSSKPVKPKIILNITLAGVISLFVAIFLSFSMEYIEKIKSGGNT